MRCLTKALPAWTAFPGFLAGFLCLGPSFGTQAQQSLFNVPSSDITEKDHWFFQEQLNLSSSGISNTTVDYGLGNKWEVGLNLFDVDLYHPKSESAVEMLALVNLQKRFDINDWWGLGIGAQLGAVVPRGDHVTRFANLDYVNSPVRLGRWGTGYVGGYVANAGFTASRTDGGFMVGADLPLVENRLHFMADYMHGTTAVGVGVVGLVLDLPKKWQFSAGAQLPAPHSGNDYGLVLEFTHL